MKSIALLLLCLAAPSLAQDENAPYTIDADAVRVDGDNGATTYVGNARAEISNLVIEADTIAVFRDNGLPSRVEASGSPIRFEQQASSGSLAGTAQQIILSVPELKLTLIDYAISDTDGNSMKGREATFVLEP